MITLPSDIPKNIADQLMVFDQFFKWFRKEDGILSLNYRIPEYEFERLRSTYNNLYLFFQNVTIDFLYSAPIYGLCGMLRPEILIGRDVTFTMNIGSVPHETI